jgi:NAD(P)-dependent dehydrogenase (short-subunit alcohol dehydrogenase family)
MKMNGNVVLVTGANRGLGRALVLEVLARGARRVYAAARDPRQLEPLGSAVIPLQVDITHHESLARAAERATDITLLINNAGVLASFGALTSDEDDIARDFQTNFFGMLAATKAFLPALERAASAPGGQAAIVNILSIVSLASMPALGTYSASKAAAHSLTQALRSDLAKTGIRVHAAFPGAIDTEMVKSFEMPKTSAKDVAQGIVDGVEQGLDEIIPDDMARELVAAWKRDPKELEHKLAAMSAG